MNLTQVLRADPATVLCHLTPLLFCDNEETRVEAARAYGNYSRTPQAREYIQKVSARNMINLK